MTKRWRRGVLALAPLVVASGVAAAQPASAAIEVCLESDVPVVLSHPATPIDPVVTQASESVFTCYVTPIDPDG